MIQKLISSDGLQLMKIIQIIVRLNLNICAWTCDARFHILTFKRSRTVTNHWSSERLHLRMNLWQKIYNQTFKGRASMVDILFEPKNVEIFLISIHWNDILMPCKSTFHSGHNLFCLWIWFDHRWNSFLTKNAGRF